MEKDLDELGGTGKCWTSYIVDGEGDDESVCLCDFPLFVLKVIYVCK